jgi:hypothetical protein
VIWTAALMLAQGPPATETTDAKAFLASLKAVLRTEKTPDRVNSFTADVLVNVRTKGANADVNATIDFHRPRYLKTVVTEQGKRKVQALTDDGPWMQQQGAPAYWATGKEYGTDRKSIHRNVAVASAMTRYLYPDRELAKLDTLEKLVKVDKKWGRGASIPTYRVRGVAKNGSAWALALTPGHKDAVRVTAWFRRKDRYPIAVRLEPLGARGELVGPLEELRFYDHQKHDALILPGVVRFFASKPGSKRLPLVQTVTIKKFGANPSKLTPDSFEKPG